MCNVKNFSDLPAILTTREVGETLGISKNTAYELVKSKGFPAIKIGKQYRIPRDKFIAWVGEQANRAA